MGLIHQSQRRAQVTAVRVWTMWRQFFFPAAVFHGALSIDGGDLALDPISDVGVMGGNGILREVIEGQ